MHRIPSLIKPPSTAKNDPRIGHFILETPSVTTARLLGFCSDNGVRENGGRTGASLAPDAIRSALYKLTADPVDPKPLETFFRNMKDDGNVPANEIELDEIQKKLGGWVSEALIENQFPIILGGGHETSYGHFLGYVNVNQPVTILNWDAHADVRPLKDGKPHSGSPFYQALEHESGLCKQYIVAGLQRHSLSNAHLEYLQGKNARYYFKGELSAHVIQNIYERLEGATMVTMDMDALDQSIAPGVSAPATHGLDLQTWLCCAYYAGKCHHVRSLDIVEMNPTLDRDSQTARVAALTLWYFAKGYGERNG